MRTIRNKILSSVIIIVLLSLAASSYLAFKRFSSILENQALAENSIHMEQTAMKVEQLIDDVYKYAGNMVNDQMLQQFASRTAYGSVYDELYAYSEVVKQLTKFNVLRDYLDSSAIIREDGKVFWSSLYTDPYFDRILQEDWYQSRIQSGAKSGFTSPHTILNSNAKEVVSFFIRFDPQYGGVLLLNIDYDMFEDTFAHLETIFDHYAWIEGSGDVWQNTGVSDERLQRVLTNTELGIQKDIVSGGYYLSSRFEKSDWSLITFTSKDRFYELVGYVLKHWAVFAFLCVILCILIFYPIVSGITRPISQMSQAMKHVSMGNYNIKLNFKSKDELSVLKHGFEKMTQDIQTQIAEKVEQEKWRSQMSTELLFAQINPHFIYNTLNTVVYMARKAKHKGIEEMMESFIGVLHDAVKIGEEGFYSTVKTEMTLIDHYVRIQQYRYADSFSLQWDIEPGTEEYLLPRSLLQPLVENAIFHGFTELEELGEIRISIHRRDERLIVVVKDNGLGMDEQALQKLQQGDSSAQKHGNSGLKSIGISNIRDRLGYLYGNAAHMYLRSTHGDGVEVTIEIPARLEDSQESPL